MTIISKHGDFELTTNHAASSYGQPVLIKHSHSDRADDLYGASDWVDCGSYAWQIAAEMRKTAAPEALPMIDKFLALADRSLVNPFDQFFAR